jgi:hypothetical protein
LSTLRIAAIILSIGLIAAAGTEPGGSKMSLSEKDIMGVIGQMHAKFGAKQKKRAETGVRQVARLWKKEDGSPEQFAKFCLTHFMVGKDLDALFARFEQKTELLRGHFKSMILGLHLEMDEDVGPLMPVDKLFYGYNPATHAMEDMFTNKIAFVALLNFPVYTLEEMLKKGPKLSRRQWAETRLAQQFAHRVPAEITQKISMVSAAAGAYITQYNIEMNKVVDQAGKSMFPKGRSLISHWGLRDELKAQYSDPKKNLAKQEMIYTIMLRIINQEIPKVVISNPKVTWDPQANTVDGKPAAREPDTRYEHLLKTYQSRKLQDPYYPDAPSHMDRRFKLIREIPEDEFVALMESALKAPVSKQVAKLVEKRLGRKLMPFDIWYDGFKARGDIGEDKLSKITTEKYPNAEAFENGMPDILTKLGFDKKTAEYLAARIEVDAARGSGHAFGPSMRTEKAHLRTRVAKEGLDYKGFNIAMHELGHNVQQVFSLYKVDHYVLHGVPNTAFTEGFAFVFQAQDLEVLGQAKPDKKKEALHALDVFWQTREMAGVSLVDIKVWHWMYDNPKATPAQLREATVKIAKEVWNEHFAPVFGIKDSEILAVYSHMIAYALYLPDYTLGHLIAFQVEDYFKTHKLGKEMERMCALGMILPNMWMKQAVGKKISPQPMINATRKALKLVKN